MAILTSKGVRAPHQLKGRRNVRVSRDRRGSGTIFNDIYPIGSMIMYAGNTAPIGYLLCQGQSLSRTDYPALFSVIGTLYGSKGGSDFSLPDMRECIPVGVGTRTSGVSDHDTYSLGEFKDDQIQQHSHTIPNSTGTLTLEYHFDDRTAGGNAKLPTESLSTVSMNGRTGTTTHGKQFGVNYIIKY